MASLRTLRKVLPMDSKAVVRGLSAQSIFIDDEVVLTPQEERAELARTRREVQKQRDLDRRNKRRTKRSQCY